MEVQARIDELQAMLVATRDRIAELEAQLAAKNVRIAELEQQVAVLTEQVTTRSKPGEVGAQQSGRDSDSSHGPPSGDSPGRKDKSSGREKPNKDRKSGRNRGGQPGHRGAHRALVPEDQVNEFIHLYPPTCEDCRMPLPEIDDPKAKRYQVIEVPPVQPHTKEFRQHAVTCTRCGSKTRAPNDERIPSSPFGPRLMSLIGMLSGVYHVSRRQTAKLLEDMVGVRISLGAVSAIEARVSEALEPAFNEVVEKVEQAKVKHTDGTSWRESGAAKVLWTIATEAATLFKIVADGSRATLEPLFGACRGILVSDRAKALGFWAMERRQICWSHLLRKFIWFSELDGPASRFGGQLLEYTGILFSYWHSYKDGKLDRRTLRAWTKPLCKQVEALLAKAEAANIDQLSGSCRDILAHRDALWTFLERDGVEPTNNHAERELRIFVLWRKLCFGTQSERGNRFAERIMTVAHTARKQGMDLFAFLTASCTAYQMDTGPPSLFNAGVAAA